MNRGWMRSLLKRKSIIKSAHTRSRLINEPWQYHIMYAQTPLGMEEASEGPEAAHTMACFDQFEYCSYTGTMRFGSGGMAGSRGGCVILSYFAVATRLLWRLWRVTRHFLCVLVDRGRIVCARRGVKEETTSFIQICWVCTRNSEEIAVCVMSRVWQLSWRHPFPIVVIVGVGFDFLWIDLSVSFCGAGWLDSRRRGATIRNGSGLLMAGDERPRRWASIDTIITALKHRRSYVKLFSH